MDIVQLLERSSFLNQEMIAAQRSGDQQKITHLIQELGHIQSLLQEASTPKLGRQGSTDSDLSNASANSGSSTGSGCMGSSQSSSRSVSSPNNSSFDHRLPRQVSGPTYSAPAQLVRKNSPPRLKKQGSKGFLGVMKKFGRSSKNLNKSKHRSNPSTNAQKDGFSGSEDESFDFRLQVDELEMKIDSCTDSLRRCKYQLRLAELQLKAGNESQVEVDNLKAELKNLELERQKRSSRFNKHPRNRAVSQTIRTKPSNRRHHRRLKSASRSNSSLSPTESDVGSEAPTFSPPESPKSAALFDLPSPSNSPLPSLYRGHSAPVSPKYQPPLSPRFAPPASPQTAVLASNSRSPAVAPPLPTAPSPVAVTTGPPALPAAPPPVAPPAGPPALPAAAPPVAPPTGPPALPPAASPLIPPTGPPALPAAAPPGVPPAGPPALPVAAPPVAPLAAAAAPSAPIPGSRPQVKPAGLDMNELAALLEKRRSD